MKAGAVDVALHRARERLRALLESHGVREPRLAAPTATAATETLG
jgi:hypothetical protein